MDVASRYELPPQAIKADPAEAAIASIRAYCGWHVAPVIRETLTVTTPSPAQASILLPTRRIREVHAVRARDAGGQAREITDSCEWAPSGVLTRRGHGPLAPSLRGLEIEMTHGYEWEEVPDLLSVFEAVKERAGRVASPVRSQSAGIYSVTYATVDGIPVHGASLLSTERDLLAPYRLNWGP